MLCNKDAENLVSAISFFYSVTEFKRKKKKFNIWMRENKTCSPGSENQKSESNHSLPGGAVMALPRVTAKKI